MQPRMLPFRHLLTTVIVVLVFVVTGCNEGLQQTGEATHGRGPTDATEPAARMITTQLADGWPRTVQDAHGAIVTIPEPPQRIHTLSLGYDEITLALVDSDRVAAIGRVATDRTLSNIAEVAAQIPHQIERDAEQILAARPDLVVASPFSKPELVQQLRDARLPVIVSDLHDSIGLHADNIRFLARLYGAEEKAEALIEQIERRLAVIERVVESIPVEARPLVLRLSAQGSSPGANTTMDGIIRYAGGVNAAAAAGLNGWQQLSLEKVVELQPDVIIIADHEDREEGFRTVIVEHPALKSVPAVVNGRVYALPDRYLSTLSHWNIRGVEELAKLLWPDAFGEVSFEDAF